MKIDKSKLTPEELATLEEIEKKLVFRKNSQRPCTRRSK